MKNPFKKGEAKKKRERGTVESQLQLAEAMNRLADGLDKFQDPLWWQKTVGQSLQSMIEVPAVREALPAGILVESMTIRLSDDEREKMANLVSEVLKPQIQEFGQFVEQSVREMPAHRLKELASQIEAGAEPKLARRRGCIFIALETGEEFHLNL